MNLKRIIGTGVLIASLSMSIVNVAMANNWTDSEWSFSVNGGSGSTFTEWRSKEDTSRVYVQNSISSSGAVAVSIYGRKGISGYGTDCTYNPINGLRNYPYTINRGNSLKCSSEVREIYGTGAMARLLIVGPTGTHYGVWSPDNYIGD